MEYKIISTIGFFLICHQICFINGNEFEFTRVSDAWTPIVTTNSIITRLHRVNETQSEVIETTVDEATTQQAADSTVVVACSGDTNNNENYLIETFTGDIIVTTILHQSDNAIAAVKFIVKQINEIGVLAHNITIGVRIVEVFKAENIFDIIENELDYSEHCIENPFGIFLSKKFWQQVSSSDKNYELKMWPLPDIEHMKMEKIAHLLNELPLPIERTNASVEIKTDSLNRTKELESVLMKTENLCFKSFPSRENVFIYVGNEEFLASVHFTTDQNLIIVPFNTSKEINFNEFPDKSFIALESEVISNITSSTLIAIAATFLEISKVVNNALSKTFNQTSHSTKVNLTKCEICNDLEVFGEISLRDIKKILNMLHIENFENQMNYRLMQKFTTNGSIELHKVATTNYITNVTTVYIIGQHEMTSFGSLYKCEKVTENSSQEKQHVDDEFHIDAFNPLEVYPQKPLDEAIDLDKDFNDMYWELRSEIWVAIGLTMASLGILLCISILTFIIIRICMDDVLEGNPIGSVVMLISLIAQFASFFPFTIEYASVDINENSDVMNSMCIIKIFLVSVSYCLTFSLLLSRAIMLASIGSEGGFLSHVNGYIQSIICVFSFFVQLGLSTQLLIVMHANSQHITCMSIYHGNWFWGVICYDALLLIMLVLLSPFIYKSQRNYQEGTLIVVTSILCLICWVIWISVSMISDDFREIAVSLGVQITAWLILSSLMVPRCFLIVKSIARSDFAQALPSLTSLAFAQANQFGISEPSIYECVNPVMRPRSIDESDMTNIPNDFLSASECPTLPLRSNNRARNFIEHYNLTFNEIVNPNLPSPNKMTRF
ncbi:hypothetical protein PVAND_009905 [Polypedilum vanderplanki]|uniref:G-protein coupled receptors family 3 profile domain-containing protein n=1 Tax=Polypedilum vanderplanki TaxID=319348 RepID=A0A9J6CE78_POLVA|nr:hypothetical protein PVAND_009905 [Polypedilum vanderplanki]